MRRRTRRRPRRQSSALPAPLVWCALALLPALCTWAAWGSVAASSLSSSSSAAGVGGGSSPLLADGIDADTLRSLGLPESEIRSLLMMEDAGGDEDEDDASVELFGGDAEMPQEVGGEYEYETYDDEEEEDEGATAEMAAGEAPDDGMDDEEEEGKGEWWLDPLAQFGEEGNSVAAEAGAAERTPEEARRRPARSRSVVPAASKAARRTRSPAAPSVVGRGGPLAAAPALALPKLGDAILHSPHSIRIIASAALVQLAVRFLASQKQRTTEEEAAAGTDGAARMTTAATTTTGGAEDGGRPDDEGADAPSRDAEEEEEEDMERLRELGFRTASRAPAAVAMTESGSGGGGGGGGTGEVAGPSPDDAAEGKKGSDRRFLSRFVGWGGGGKSAEDGEEGRGRDGGEPSVKVKKKCGAFSRGEKRQLRRLTKRELLGEVEALRERAETAEAERETMEHEYESANEKVRELWRGIEATSKTNGQLRAELRDMQRRSESALRAERQRVNEEMVRVRESLVSVLERERRLMRAQMMRSAERVRSMVREEKEMAGGNPQVTSSS